MSAEACTPLESLFGRISNEGARREFEQVAACIANDELAKSHLSKGLSLLLGAPASGPSKASAASIVSDVPPELSEAVAVLPDVTCIAPRGSFALGFDEESLSLRGKTANLLIRREDALNARVIEQTSAGTTLLVRLTSTSSAKIPGGILLISVKGNNQGKGRTVINAERRGELNEPMVTIAEDASSSRSSILEGLINFSLGKLQRFQPKLVAGRPVSPFIHCNIKDVREGRLFFLEEALLFVGSPLTLVEIQDIESAALRASNTKMHELNITLSEPAQLEYGKGSKDGHVFSQISADDLLLVYDFLDRLKRVKTSGRMSSADSGQVEDLVSEGSLSSDDSDYQSQEATEDSDEEEKEQENEDDKTASETDPVEVVELSGSEESGDESDDTSSSGTDDPEAAELVEEDDFVPDETEIIKDGQKRRRVVAA
jgi:hypothetical protein